MSQLPLRPLGAGEILDGAVRVVRRRLPAAVAITLPVAVVSTVAGALLSAAARTSSAATIAGALITTLLGGLFGTLLAGLLAPLVVADLRGESITAGETLRRVGGRWLPLAVLAVVVTLGQELGLVLLVVGGVWLWGLWTAAAPALVLERLGPVAALRRSAALVSGSFWRVWGVRALGYVVTSALGLLVSLPFTALAGYLDRTNPFDTTSHVTHPALFLTITAIGTLIGAIVLLPVTAVIQVLLYTDQRMRREGMDLVLALPPEPAARTW